MNRFPKLNPPLHIPSSENISPKVVNFLSIAYARLHSASYGTLGEKENWALLGEDWFKQLLVHTSENQLSNIEMHESLLPNSYIDFLGWLNSEVQIFSGRPKFQERLKSWNHLLRNYPMYSYEKFNKIDIEFYTFEHCSAELSLLAEGSMYRQKDPLLDCLIRYAHFTAIHPFPDGNGRASRLLLTSQLIDMGLWKECPLPIGFLLHRDRMRYIKHIREALILNEWNNYFAYMLNILSAACELSAITRYIYSDQQ